MGKEILSNIPFIKKILDDRCIKKISKKTELRDNNNSLSLNGDTFYRDNSRWLWMNNGNPSGECSLTSKEFGKMLDQIVQRKVTKKSN
ncbi:MAG: hypothetical protein PHO75_00300 [Candidatus Shapirobacteria bacterium]|jgi:hypothetical protein|nr:hypothetical protein [Candidatus Shapirobacteria bacterium]